jgi:hypothetical protein
MSHSTVFQSLHIVHLKLKYLVTFQSGWDTVGDSDLYSGLSHFSPSSRSQVIFSHVVIISPNEASTIVFPVSRDDTLHNTHRELSSGIRAVRTCLQVKQKGRGMKTLEMTKMIEHQLKQCPYSHIRS